VLFALDMKYGNVLNHHQWAASPGWCGGRQPFFTRTHTSLLMETEWSAYQYMRMIRRPWW